MPIEHMTIVEQLERHEGLRLHPYRCTAGKLTIGIGRNIESVGISKEEAYILLDNDIKSCRYDLCNLFQNFPHFDERIQRILVDMRFNLGYLGFRDFRKMISAVRKKDWSKVAAEMKDSAWFTQVGERGQNLYKLMKKVAEEMKP